MVVVLIIMSFICAHPVSVFANGWVEKNHSSHIYGGAGSTSSADAPDDTEDMGTVEKYFVQLLIKGSDEILTFFDEQTIPLSIDGIVLGRLADGIDVSFAKFELAKNNPWGVMGAIVYRTLAVGVLGFFLLSFLGNLIKYLFKSNSGKERAAIKEYIYNFVFWFLVLFAGYNIIDWVLYVVDVFIFSFQKHILAAMSISTADSVSLVTSFRDAAGTGIINALMYFASVFSGVFFISNYIGTAIIQMGGFGAMPAVCLKATNNKRAFATWSEIFVSNMCIPLVDSILLLMPSAYYVIVKAAQGQTAADSFSVSFVRLLIIWAIIPSRNMILRLMGGPNASVNGMRGLASMALLAARSLGRGGSSLRHRGNIDDSVHETFQGNMEKSRLGQSQADIFSDAHNATTAGLSDIDNLLAGRGTPEENGIKFDTEEGVGIGSGGASSSEELEEMLVNGADLDASNTLHEEPDGINQQEDGDIVLPVEEPDLETIDGIGKSEALDMSSEEDGGDIDYESDVVENTGMYREGIMKDADGMESIEGADIETDGLGEMSGGASYEEAIAHEADSIAADGSELENAVKNPGEMGAVEDGVDVSPYQNIPNMDSDFAKSLNDADLDRYANLSARDALKEELYGNKRRLNEIDEDMVNNSTEMARATRENGDLSAANAEIEARNETLRNEISGLQSRNAEIDSNRMLEGANDQKGEARTRSSLMGETEKAHNNEIIAEKMDELSRNESMLSDNKAKIAANNRNMGALEAKANGYRIESAKIHTDNQKLQEGIENCTARERQYSDNYANAGMGRKNYQDAKSFQIDAESTRAFVKDLNYRNFDKGDFEKNLTPEQRAKFYRERAVKDAASQVAGTVVRTGAQVAGGVVGAAAMTYGGPSAMMMGAYFGADASGKVADTAGKAVSGIGAAAIKAGTNAQEFHKAHSAKTTNTKNGANGNKKNKKEGENKKTTEQTPGTGGKQTDQGRDLRETYRKEVEEMNHQFEKYDEGQ